MYCLLAALPFTVRGLAAIDCIIPRKTRGGQKNNIGLESQDGQHGSQAYKEQMDGRLRRVYNPGVRQLSMGPPRKMKSMGEYNRRARRQRLSPGIPYTMRLPDGRTVYVEVPARMAVRDRTGKLAFTPEGVRFLDNVRALGCRPRSSENRTG
jgi:hypothetical protein